MPNLTADRVKETTTTTGTGTITLAGAVAQYRSFASAFADGSVVQYAIVGQTGTEWEVGNGTFTASGTTLARTTVLASSNSNNAVNFSAGTKDVFATVTGDHMLNPVLTRADIDNLRIDGNGISSTNTDGNITLVPNGAGVFGVGTASPNASYKLDVDGGATSPYSARFSTSSGSNIVRMTSSGGDDFIRLDNSGGSWAFGYIDGSFPASGGSFLILDYAVPAVALALQPTTSILALRSVGHFGWTASSAAAAADTSFARVSAGVIRAAAGGAEVRALIGGGAAVASAAALPVPTGRVFHVTGTTNITSITSTNFQAGVAITMIFDGVLTVTDGNNLKLAGNFVTAADSTLSLVYDGTNWYETGRSTN